MLGQYGACVVDLLGLDINMCGVYCTLRVLNIKILSTFFLWQPYIPLCNFEEFFIYLMSQKGMETSCDAKSLRLLSIISIYHMVGTDEQGRILINQHICVL